jgi:nitrite reductase (NO-forming)
MTKQLNGNWLLGALIVSAALFFLIFPISIEIKPITTAAQETPTTTVDYTLRTMLGGDPAMAFVGVGGDIDGVTNPTLTAKVGDTVNITVINGNPVLHDLTIDEFAVATGPLTLQDETVTVTFIATAPGEYVYYCSVPGHRDIGMWGTITISGEASDYVGSEQATPVPDDSTVAVAPAAADAVSIIRNPADVPAALGNREPTTVRFDLTTQEVTGQLADGTTFDYFTFDGTVPGPMLRVRVGDTIEMHIHNPADSLMIHSIDLHATTGPGGGAVFTQTNPGEETMFTFTGLNPGLYVYHCATPSVAHHIANGMYGMILVEPEGGLSPVDREFYVMQGEIYTEQDFGTQGHLTFSHERMLDEAPEYFVFNGAAGALTQDEYALRANVGETVRIYFGVGGPNFTSSFHVIGEIFDRMYSQASLTSEPLTNVQTTTVPPGGAVMVEFAVEVPGRYILVDHALSRLERGLAGYLYVEGDANPEIFDGEATAGSGH